MIGDGCLVGNKFILITRPLMKQYGLDIDKIVNRILNDVGRFQPR